MKQAYFIGLDNGGSTSKCVIFDSRGLVCAATSARIPMQRSNSGHTERDAELLYSENCRLIKEALRRAGLRGEDVAGVGLCGLGGGLGMLDVNKKPLAPFIISTDSRAESLVQEWNENGVDAQVYARTMQHIWPGQPAALLPWLLIHEPELIQRCSYFLPLKDYLRFRLTGVLGTEVTDASNTNLFHLKKRCFDAELFQILGIAPLYKSAPPRLFAPNEVAGYITAEAAAQTGLSTGTPVAAGLYDVASCCLASGILDKATLCLIIGTWSISGHLTSSLDDCIGANTALCSFLDGGYFLEESSPTSVSNLDWFVEQYYRYLPKNHAENVYENCNATVAALHPENSDLIFLPYLYSSNSVAGAKGCFFNLASHHTSKDVLLAIYEGVLFSLRYHVERLYSEAEAAPKAARLSGGVSKSDIWCQMLADVLGVTVSISDCEELGALGGAMCAAIAVGKYRDYSDAVSAMSHTLRSYSPQPDRVRIFQQKYEQFQKAIQALALFQKNFLR